jgi:hypothetical protein
MVAKNGSIATADRLIKSSVRSVWAPEPSRSTRPGLGVNSAIRAWRASKLDVWTASGAGTETALGIPGSIAYGIAPARGILGLFRKKGG